MSNNKPRANNSQTLDESFPTYSQMLQLNVSSQALKIKKDQSFVTKSAPEQKTLDINQIDYTNLSVLRSYITDACRIMPRRFTGLTRQKQTKLRREIKRAINLGLLPPIPSQILDYYESANTSSI